jgi:hypothetical protein
VNRLEGLLGPSLSDLQKDGKAMHDRVHPKPSYGVAIESARMLEGRFNDHGSEDDAGFWADRAAEWYIKAGVAAKTSQARHDVVKRAYEVASSRRIMDRALEMRLDAAKRLFDERKDVGSARNLYDAGATLVAEQVGTSLPVRDYLIAACRFVCGSEHDKDLARTWHNLARKCLQENPSYHAHIEVSMAAQVRYIQTKNKVFLIERYDNLMKATRDCPAAMKAGLFRNAAKTAMALSRIERDDGWHDRANNCYLRMGDHERAR